MRPYNRTDLCSEDNRQSAKALGEFHVVLVKEIEKIRGVPLGKMTPHLDAKMRLLQKVPEDHPPALPASVHANFTRVTTDRDVIGGLIQRLLRLQYLPFTVETKLFNVMGFCRH